MMATERGQKTAWRSSGKVPRPAAAGLRRGGAGVRTGRLEDHQSVGRHGCATLDQQRVDVDLGDLGEVHARSAPPPG